MRWALEALIIDHLTIARVAAGLGVAWHTANDAVLAEGQRLLIEDPDRFDAVRVLGVEEHVWRDTRRGDRYVTVDHRPHPAQEQDRTGEALPGAVAVMDLFHVVRLAGDALDDCRRRVQQQLHRRKGRNDDPLYKTRRTLRTGTKL